MRYETPADDGNTVAGGTEAGNNHPGISTRGAGGNSEKHGGSSLPVTPFAEWIRQRRHAVRLTQTQLASHAGIHASHLQRIESGRAHPTRLIVERLAAAVGGDNEEALVLAYYIPASADYLLDAEGRRIAAIFHYLSPPWRRHLLRVTQAMLSLSAAEEENRERLSRKERSSP
jgi:transcriptional regulator with XRE-family HTH domain